ncbi:hypothetical protein GA0116948_10231 [Chitinophaga costaii]|uniref:Uncharacterized protein n=1 Tax=Chitinophaga costaii TaxID=1335309 RepID=A0A1C4A9I3_9BACT|nr:hypothetical protein [Chitinophaga costaii]PUZ26517.1 hypothetical protein DCM91_08850 [Chitinophaga costaii]SCB91298.1 hypothetical protein GA0116948_10231 [Chitinophaga costaii]
MAAFFGAHFSGTLYRFCDQAIKTKFFTIAGVPLLPQGSYYQTGTGKDIPMLLSEKSVWAAYSRITMPVIGMCLLMANNIYCLLLFAAIMVNALINWFSYFYVSEPDKAARQLLQTAFGYNMLPELLPRHVQVKLHNELCSLFKHTYGNTAKWEDMVKKGQLDEATRPILYALARYARIFNNEFRYDELFNKVAKYHQPIPMQ